MATRHDAVTLPAESLARRAPKYFAMTARDALRGRCFAPLGDLFHPRDSATAERAAAPRYVLAASMMRI
jgi:hypothetical protein